ncbi:protease HtpX [bacterium]|nr:protease HtpX [bacterium]
MAIRIALFILSNIFFVATITIVCGLLGIDSYITEEGLNYGALAGICLIYGFVASGLSLAFSRIVAKRALGVKVVRPTEQGNLQWLAILVHDLARQAGIPAPEVGVYRSDDMNAFATGPSKSRSLVAFSSALLKEMDRDAIEGVAAHEIAHIQNGDMVTMTLLQGVVNAFVMFFARIIAHFASSAVKEQLAGIVWWVTVIVMQIVFGLLGMLVTSAFSRKREFRADSGSAKLVGSAKMIKGLEALLAHGAEEEEGLPETAAALGISGGKSPWLQLLSTHPPLEERIQALQVSGR